MDLEGQKQADWFGYYFQVVVGVAAGVYQDSSVERMEVGVRGQDFDGSIIDLSFGRQSLGLKTQ